MQELVVSVQFIKGEAPLALAAAMALVAVFGQNRLDVLVKLRQGRSFRRRAGRLFRRDGRHRRGLGHWCARGTSGDTGEQQCA